MYNHRRHLSIATLLVAASTFVVYLLLYQMFESKIMVGAVTEAGPIDVLFQAHFWVIAFLFSLITVFLLYSTVIFRRREGDDTPGEYIHGNTAVEIAWTVAPIGVVLVFAFWGSNMLIDITQMDRSAENSSAWTVGVDEDAEQAWVVKVTGFKWAWGFEYPDGTQLASLVVPVDVPVILEMESTDVIHSFWVPEFRVKQDLLPGTKKYLRFTPNMTSEEIVQKKLEIDGIRNYRVQVRCAEICGTRHAYMYANVYSVDGGMDGAMSRVNEIANDIPEVAADRGELWYNEYGCNACHSLDGTLDGYSGPSWLNIYEQERELADGSVVVADDAYIRNSIYAPNAQLVAGYAAGVMPQNFETQFAEREASLAARGREIDTVADLIEFMKTLSE